MKRETFAKAIAYLAAGFDTELSEARLKVYWDQVRGFRDEPFQRAAREAVKHCPYFPTVKQLRQLYVVQLERGAEFERPRITEQRARAEVADLHLRQLRRELRLGERDHAP